MFFSALYRHFHPLQEWIQPLTTLITEQQNQAFLLIPKPIKVSPWLVTFRKFSNLPQEIFFRKLDRGEKPMELSFLWRLNNEKRSFVITDHDLNATRFVSSWSRSWEPVFSHCMNKLSGLALQLMIDLGPQAFLWQPPQLVPQHSRPGSRFPPLAIPLAETEFP